MQAVSSQQLQEARNETAGLHVQLANLKASQQQVQSNQVRGMTASQFLQSTHADISFCPSRLVNLPATDMTLTH